MKNKKGYLAGVFALLMLISCGSDSDEVQYPVFTGSPLLGEWKKSKEIIFSGKNNSIIATYDNNDPCEKNATTKFAADGKVHFKQFYKNSNGNCIQHPIETKSYSYDPSAKKLYINDVLYGEIIMLTGTLQEIKVNLDYDENGDGVKDYAIEYGYK